MSSRALLIIFVFVLLGAIFITGSQGKAPFNKRQKNSATDALIPSQERNDGLALLLPNAYPVRKAGIAAPEGISAHSSLSILVKNDGKAMTLFEKDSGLILPIASIAKLMTALVAVKHYPQDHIVTISKVEVNGTNGYSQFKIGDKFAVQTLLKPLLIESNNDAAIALAAIIGNSAFVEFMNLEAQELGLSDTTFIDPAGLSPENVSTPQDLFILMRAIHERYPQIFEILGIAKEDLYTAQGEFRNTMVNTNELLNHQDWPMKVLAGKTGSTPQAKESLILVIEGPNKRDYIVNIVLGSDDRFEDTKRLIDWILQAYQW